MRKKLKTNLVSLIVAFHAACSGAAFAAGNLQVAEAVSSTSISTAESHSVSPSLVSLDRSMEELIAHWKIPGAAVAMVKDGQVIFARGYGFADVDQQRPIDPGRSLFRIASISKTITAAAVLKLVEQNKLHLDDKVFSILNVKPAIGARPDKRLADISVQQLLDMSAGWDKAKSGDPMLQPFIHRAAHRLSKPEPADFEMTLRYVVGHKLDFDPGTKFAYSNFEYGLLGKLIEQVSGEDYATFVARELAAPCGVNLQPGRTRFEDRLADEVVYYAPNESRLHSFLPAEKWRVPAPYARAYMEADLPMIGWLTTATDLAKLFDKIASDDNLLNADSRKLMVSRPPIPAWEGKRKYFSLGWEVTEENGGKVSVYKDGTLPGTRSFARRTADGITWVALFNSRPKPTNPDKFAMQVCELFGKTASALGTPIDERSTVAKGCGQ